MKLSSARLPRVHKITLRSVTWGKLIIAQGKENVTKGKFNQGKDMVTQEKLSWVNIHTQGKFTLCRVTWGQFNQCIITQGNDEVTQSKFNLGRYNLGKVTWGKINRGMITQGITLNGYGFSG